LVARSEVAVRPALALDEAGGFVVSDITGSEIALIITAAGSLVAALASAAAVIIGALNTVKLNRTAANVQKIEVATNSLTDRLVASTALSEHARGKVEGRAELKSEQGSDALAVKVDKEKT
jgi:hypothetical protein